MTRLVAPSFDRYEEWGSILAEFDGAHLDGSGTWDGHRPEATPEFFRDWVALLITEGNYRLPPLEGRVKSSYFWITDDAENWVGFLALRRSIDHPVLREVGGHIGYSVRPTRRRQSHASSALALALPEAAKLGIASVLVTCDVDNLASAATIEKVGGVFEDVRQGKRRYWIGTG